MKFKPDAFIEFIKGADFLKALLLTLAIVVPILVSIQYGQLNVGVAMAIGVLLASPSDVQGSFRRRFVGISASILIAVFATIITGYAAGNIFLFVPVLAVLTFSFSLISVYGFRASLIAFSGLFAVVLSMANVSSENSILFHALLIGCGGLIYLVFTVFFNYFYQRKQAEGLLEEIFMLTSDYLKLRAEMLTSSGSTLEKLKNKLALLQIDINEKHETLRELIISRRLKSGRSGGNRKKLLIFMELVDILELGMANPVNYQKMKHLFKGNETRLLQLQEWSFEMAEVLKATGLSLKEKKEIQVRDLEPGFKKLKEAISNFSNNDAALPVYRHLLHFRERQFRKIISIERIIANLDNFKKNKIRKREAKKFITHQEYDLRRLKNNFDLKSPIFRHSLRLTIILLIGFVIGKLLDVQNAYWILLTSLVILRPGYALTKERFKKRLYGTLIGGAVATSLILITQNQTIHAILAIVSFVLAFSMIQKNYKAAAIFITLNVVFVYSLLTPNAFEVIQFRLLDTIIGAGLAFIGNSFFLPTWEFEGIKKFIAESVEANKNYLGEISDFYKSKNSLPTSYKLKRKQAFLASGNLSAAFQRITQEPTSKEETGKIYEIVTLNQELLASIASLGTFINTHQTTTASIHFDNYSAIIQENLINVIARLEGKPEELVEQVEKIEQAQIYFQNLMYDLSENKEVLAAEENLKKYQEARLIAYQMEWLLQISTDLRILIGKFQQREKTSEENKSHPFEVA